jgi:hypothetical protein
VVLSDDDPAVFTITAAGSSVVVKVGTEDTFTFSGGAQGPDAGDFVVSGSGGAVTVSYSGTLADGTPYGPSATAPTGAGSYQVVVSVAADDNFSSASSEPFEFTITAATVTVKNDTSDSLSRRLSRSSAPGWPWCSEERCRSSDRGPRVRWVRRGSTRTISSTCSSETEPRSGAAQRCRRISVATRRRCVPAASPRSHRAVARRPPSRTAGGTSSGSRPTHAHAPVGRGTRRAPRRFRGRRAGAG